MKKRIGMGVLGVLLVALGTLEANAQRLGGQTVQPASLTLAERGWILQLREEEKLARDVYLTLAKRWKVPIFSNIAKSESNHMAAVKNLIIKYGLPDPVVKDTVGVFTNPAFAELYKDLVAAGSVSIVDAYEVGVIIEEMDIEDLAEAVLEVQKADVRTVFENLLSGSENHLAAFESQL
jgi:hypothetical protein